MNSLDPVSTGQQQAQEHLNSEQLVEEIYREFAPEVDPSRWPWEMTRWYELVFCVLFSVGEPEVPAVVIRELTTTLSNFGLLEINHLAEWKKTDGANHDEQVTVKTMLQKAGFTSSQIATALKIIEHAAFHLNKTYESKIQIFLRKFGEEMLEGVMDELDLKDYPESHQALSLWMQNTLNMPIPAIDPLAEKACQHLGVAYRELVEAATAQDINIALLDDALRNYWENEVIEKPYQKPGPE